MSVVVCFLQRNPSSPIAFSVAWLAIPLVPVDVLLYTFARYRMTGKLPGMPPPVPWIEVLLAVTELISPSAVLYLLAPMVVPGQKFVGHCAVYFPKE